MRPFSCLLQLTTGNIPLTKRISPLSKILLLTKVTTFINFCNSKHVQKKRQEKRQEKRQRKDAEIPLLSRV